MPEARVEIGGRVRMALRVGADAVAGDRAVGARVELVDRDLAVRIGLLELLKRRS